MNDGSRLVKQEQRTNDVIADAVVMPVDAVNVYPEVVIGQPYYEQPPLPPPSLHQGSSQSGIDEAAARQFLFEKGWPLGLQSTLISSLAKIPFRYFICDDSGSMMSQDGNHVLGTGKNTKLVSCSRWTELTDALRFHVALAKKARAPSEFRLLNKLGPVTIGACHISDTNAMMNERTQADRLERALDESPDGGTPLCRHVREVIAKITPMAPALLASGQKVALVICTDGEPSDGNIVEAMRPLHDLPVWVVVRLCTDDSRISEYWSNVDKQLELHMDVIDDLVGEAQEVHEKNQWVTYGEPLQRLREFGVTVKEIDLMDEICLSPEQTRVVCALLLNLASPRDLPHPQEDLASFCSAVQTLCDKEMPVWSPVLKRLHTWIDVPALRAHCDGTALARRQQQQSGCGRQSAGGRCILS